MERLVFYINGDIARPHKFESQTKAGLLKGVRQWIKTNLLETRHLNGTAPVKSLAFVNEAGRLESLRYDVQYDGWSIRFSGLTMMDFSPNYREIRDMFIEDAVKAREVVPTV